MYYSALEKLKASVSSESRTDVILWNPLVGLVSGYWRISLYKAAKLLLASPPVDQLVALFLQQVVLVVAWVTAHN